MPASPHPLPPHRRRSWPGLALLALAVLLVHALLLGGLRPLWQRLAGAEQPPAERVLQARLELRSPAPESAPPAARPAAPSPVPAPRKSPPARTVPPAQTPPAPEAAATEATPAPQPVPPDTPADASATAANAQPPLLATAAATARTPASPASFASASAPAAPAPEPAAAAPAAASAVALPPSARLLYDGRGEERGFIKYAASAEMLWLQEGGQYSARLEISAWGFRVRTWTSKGAVSSTGLAPLRFGDKPRGAELATHFQRDKGIISFSANNPDVPLQDGAQDKLSAILQLSALVAGAPERYQAGSSIRFQAADAHRAEVWDFRVGGLELLELPGGPMQALKLSKAPTVEFDQGIEVWLAPGMQYLPVRLRITEANGAYADLLWRKTQNSE